MDQIKKTDQNKSSSSGDDIFLVILILGLLFGAHYIWSNWKGDILHIVGGIAVLAVATVIISGATEKNEKAQNLVFGIYFLGVFFAGVLSYVSFGLSSWILLHGSLSWIYIFLMR